MIDFRYHIVSIVAVFLALALGLVLGTRVDPLVVGDLRDRVTQLVNDKRGLQNDVESLRAQAADGVAFARAATIPLVQDQLAGRSVVVVSLPSVPSGMRDDVLRLLDQAGAHVTARITLSGRYADPQQEPLLVSTVATATPPGVILSGTTASQRAAELLATVLTEATAVPGPVPSASPSTSVSPTVTATRAALPSGATAATGSATRSAGAGPTAPVALSPSPVAPTPSPSLSVAPPGAGSTASVLAAYQAAGLLTVDADAARAADLVLVLTPDGPADGHEPPTVDVNRYLDLVGALSGARHASVVVAGPTTAVAGGVVADVRGSGVANLVSTVDGAETPFGLVATIRVLRAQLFGTVGRYGIAANDQSLPVTPAQ